MHRRATQFLTVLILMIIGGIAHADTPATQPTTAPTSTAVIQRSFLQLSDPDSKLRDQAKIDLMGLSLQDLPALRQIAADNAPLTPQVISALHEIVVQVFLASDQYATADGTMSDASGTEGPFFLGILWQSQGDQLRLGVSVDERLPGFPSYRFLRTGDMILGVLSDPSLPLDQLPNMEVHNIDSLKNSILTKPQNIALQVLRGGEVIQIAIKMAPRPQFAVPALQPQNAAIQNNARVIENFSSIRAQHADDYWHLNFDAVVDPHSDTTASNPLE